MILHFYLALFLHYAIIAMSEFLKEQRKIWDKRNKIDKISDHRAH
jgi:hypothetical protein